MLYPCKYGSKGSGSSAVDLGTGTSFDVSNYADYQSFTTDNFAIVPTASKSGSASGGATSEGSSGHTLSCSCSFTPNYDSSTGVFTVSCRLYAHSQFRNNSGNATYDNTSNINVHAYLIL